MPDNGQPSDVSDAAAHLSRYPPGGTTGSPWGIRSKEEFFAHHGDLSLSTPPAGLFMGSSPSITPFATRSSSDCYHAPSLAPRRGRFDGPRLPWSLNSCTEEDLVGVPISQMWTVASYVLKQKIQRRKRVPAGPHA